MNERVTQEAAFNEMVSKLNPEQRKAVETTEGPVLVIAGPGTGKTQILSARIGNILMQGLAEPQNILCLTYTDAGTIAMRKRLLQFIESEAYKVNIFTFHAFCNQVIQDNLEHFGRRALQPISELEQVDIFRELIDSFDNEHPLKRLKGDVYFESARLRNLFTLMKREGWSPEYVIDQCKAYLDDLPNREEYQYARAYKQFKKGDPKIDKIEKEKERINKTIAAAGEFEHFEQLMQKYHRYDYEDMILWVIKAFKENSSMLRQYQEQFQYILVDEYQDTNGAQNEVLKLLISYWEEPNVFVVGDDDQSIYRFQGANMSNIMDFNVLHQPNIEIIVLDKNYRSTQQVLDAAQTSITNNKERLVNQVSNLTKNLIASNPIYKDLDVPVAVIPYLNSIHEEADILAQLKHYKGNLAEVAIIYRGHAQVENLVKLLRKHEIPVNIKQRINVLDLPLIKQVLTIMEYIHLEHDSPYSGEHLLFEIIHYPFFNLDLQDISKVLRHATINRKVKYRDLVCNSELLLRIGVVELNKFSSLRANIEFWIKEVNNYTLQVLFEKILTKGEILDYIMRHEDRSWLLQVITTLFDFIKEENTKDAHYSLKQLLDTIDKMKTNKLVMPVNKLLHSESGVHLITAHSSKGLEFEKVFIIGANKDKWESKRGNQFDYKLPDTITSSEEADPVEEERRLFYVGMTRAQKELQLSYNVSSTTGKALEPSRFIAEVYGDIPGEELTKYLPDDQILNYHAELLQDIVPVDPPLIDHNLVDERLKNFSLSVTSVNKYLKCPLTFYFETILRIPTARNAYMGFGRAVHAALDGLFNQYKNQEVDVTEEVLLDFFTKGMQDSYSHFTEPEFENFLTHGTNVLKGYFTEHQKHWNTVTVSEYRVQNAQVDQIPINGIFDKVEFNGKQANIVDYKTGKYENGRKKLAPPSDKNPLGGDYWRQIIFYKILMDADPFKDWEMVSGEIDFVEPDKDGKYRKEKVVLNPDHIEVVKDQIREVHKGVMAHDFTGCGEPDCQWCNFVKENFESKNLKMDETYLEEE